MHDINHVSKFEALTVLVILNQQWRMQRWNSIAVLRWYCAGITVIT